MLCSLYSVFILPTVTLQLPWLRVFRAFSSDVRPMPGYNSQRRGTARTLPSSLLTVLFYLLFVCKWLLYYCHRVSTQLQLINVSVSISIWCSIEPVCYKVPHCTVDSNALPDTSQRTLFPAYNYREKMNTELFFYFDCQATDKEF
jgi:hypothetical protein